MFHNNNQEKSVKQKNVKKKIKCKFCIKVVAFYAAIKIQVRKNCKIK